MVTSSETRTRETSQNIKIGFDLCRYAVNRQIYQYLIRWWQTKLARFLPGTKKQDFFYFEGPKKASYNLEGKEET